MVAIAERISKAMHGRALAARSRGQRLDADDALVLELAYKVRGAFELP